MLSSHGARKYERNLFFINLMKNSREWTLKYLNLNLLVEMLLKSISTGLHLRRKMVWRLSSIKIFNHIHYMGKNLCNGQKFEKIQHYYYVQITRFLLIGTVLHISLD